MATGEFDFCEPCDVCGMPVTGDNVGLRTAEALMCHECVAKYQPPTADDEADLGGPPESGLGIPHEGGEG